MHVTVPYAVSATDTAAVVAELRDRTEIADALYRYGLGLDLGDADLFGSAFAPDAEWDFRPAAARWGGRPPLLSGRDTITTVVLGGFAGRVATTHQATNPRIAVDVDGDAARLTALVEAQHLLIADRSVRALLKNRCDLALVRADPGWVITTMRVDNLWYAGDPAGVLG